MHIKAAKLPKIELMYCVPFVMCAEVTFSAKKHNSKVVVDKCFEEIFDEDKAGKKKLKQTGKGKDKPGRVDKFGRKFSETHEKDNLRRFYWLEHEEDEEAEAPTSTIPDYGCGDVLMESSSKSEPESEDAGDSDGESNGPGFVTLGRDLDEEGDIDLDESVFADLDAQAAAYARTAPEDNSEDAMEKTRRLAVVNLDWDHVRAAHLYKIFSSLVSPAAPATLPMPVPMQPKDEKSLQNTKSAKATITRGRVLSVRVYPNGADYDEDALRKYQLERLRYYYAIVECDTTEAAVHIYNELEVTELERSANVFNLSFVPDEMAFDEEYRDEATDDPGTRYRAVEFVTDTITVKKKEIEEADFKAYITSSSSSESDNDPDSVLRRRSKKNTQRDKLRTLLLAGDGDELPEGWLNALYNEVLNLQPTDLSAYRKGSPPVTSDADRSLEFPRRHGSQYRLKLKCQSVSQAINLRLDGDKETSLLPLVWVEIRDNVIPPHTVSFASDSHGPLFIARAYLEGAFFLGKAGPQLTSGAIISYGSLEITVVTTTFEVVILLNDVLVCARRLSWEIPYSSGTSFTCQDTVITKYHINHGLEQALTYHQDIPENAYNSADNHNEVNNNQHSATPDPAIVASHTRARSHSTYGLSSKESSDVDILKAHDTFVPLKSPLELTERSRSLPPRARRSAESNFDARAKLGTFRVASAVEYSANERGTPAGSFSGSEITGFREVVNVDGRSAYSSSPREPPAQSVHAGFAQDVLPRRRYSNTGIAPSTPDDSHFTPMHYSSSLHKVSSDSPPADTIGISGNLSDFGHVDQYDQWASPIAKTHVWQRAQTCDGTGSDVIASERPAPIIINPSNAGIVTSEVKLLSHPYIAHNFCISSSWRQQTGAQSCHSAGEHPQTGARSRESGRSYLGLCLGSQRHRKTTTMLFKILGIQRAWEMSAVDMPKPRQIFVTKSRLLAMRAEEYFTKLLESLTHEMFRRALLISTTCPNHR
ncbi:hypothetical protein EV424DRAFT_1354192 [Suillus variegatus]|nr:hypothetical protein EV424DRAFT_1354192 [Suillus variegatus]